MTEHEHQLWNDNPIEFVRLQVDNSNSFNVKRANQDLIKQLTNIRSSGKDDAVDLTTPIEMGLDKAIAYISNDELVEVTPDSIRLRKRFLDIHERKRHSKQSES